MYKSVREMKEAHRKLYNGFPKGFAFNNEQFREMMSGWGLCNGKDGNPTAKDKEQIVSIGAGGFIRRTDVPAYMELMKRIDAEEKEFRRDKKKFTEEIYHAMQNVEYHINTQGNYDVCNELGRREEDLEKDPYFAACFEAARKKFLKNCA